MSDVVRTRSKRLREMLRAAEQQGFTIERGTRGGHLKVIRSDGQFVVVSTTSHDGGPTWKADRSRLRRLGVELP